MKLHIARLILTIIFASGSLFTNKGSLFINALSDTSRNFAK